MNRCAFVSAAVLVCALAFSPVLTAQTAKPTPATSSGSTAPAAPAKFVPMVTGVASIEVIQSPPKRQGSDIVTLLRIKNVSSGAIGLLRVDELWYDKDLKQVTGDTETVKRILPGEIVEITMKSPAKPNLSRSQYAFSQNSGNHKVDAKAVKKFTGGDTAKK